MRHFKYKYQALKYMRANSRNVGLYVWKKKVGMPRRNTHPYMVGTSMEWLNYNY